MATESPTNDAMKGPWITGWFFRLTSRGDGAPSDENTRQSEEADAAADDHRFSEDSHKSAAYHDAMQTLPTVRPHIPRAGAPRPGLPSPPPRGSRHSPPDLSLPDAVLSFLPVPLSSR